MMRLSEIIRIEQNKIRKREWSGERVQVIDAVINFC